VSELSVAPITECAPDFPGASVKAFDDGESNGGDLHCLISELRGGRTSEAVMQRGLRELPALFGQNRGPCDWVVVLHSPLGVLETPFGEGVLQG